jgi:two-component system phosphate regulon sensor histidine kinase PhoR
MPRIQAKLMFGLATVVVLTVLVAGYVAERGLHAQRRAALESSLAIRATLVAQLISDVPLELAYSQVLTTRVRRAAESASARITIMAPDGAVVADSEVDAVELDRIVNHGARAEMRAALAGEVGSASRTSATVGRAFLYVAIPAGSPQRGVVRLAVDLPDLEEDLAQLRRELVAAGAAGLAGAFVLGLLFSWMGLRSFREMRDVLAALAGGDLSRRLRWHVRDERQQIADAVNTMAAELEGRVQELTRDREQLRAVLDGMVEGVLVTDSGGKVLLANRALRELFRVWGEVEGRLPLEVVRNADVDALVAECRDGPGTITRELELGTSPSRTIEAHAVPLEGGRGVVAVFHDMTELRRLEAMRRDFVANASHELKTPVTAIRGFAEVLATQEISETDRRNQLDIVRRNAERLTALIDDLLELSRIESGHMELRPADLDLQQLAVQVLEDLAPMFSERQIAVRLEDSVAPLARADPDAVEQILRNLLDNAAKYTDPGGEVVVRVRGWDASIRVEVSDTGIGIAPADLTRIFERFYRVDASRSRALGGTGLGLAIVKHLVQALGGEVHVRSELGTGTTFTVSFPRAKST